MSAFRNIEIFRKNFFELFIILLSLLFIAVEIIYSSGNLTPDALEYIKQAKYFWEYKANFPLLYPFVIKVCNILIGNFFITSKVVNVFAYLGTVYFSYKKRFYFTETVLLFSFYPFIHFYSTSLSEPLFYFFNYLLIYNVYQIIHKDFRTKNLIWFSILCFLLVATRFSGLFSVFPALLFIIYHYFENPKARKKLFILLITSISAVLFYLLVNKLYCGFFLGQREHLAIIHESKSNFFYKKLESFGREFSLLNAFLHKGILEKFSHYHWLATIIMLLYVGFELIKQKLYKQKWVQFLLISLAFSLIGILYSYYTTRIDETIRVKSNAYFFVIMLLLLVMQPKILKVYQIMVAGILIINVCTLIRYSESINAYISKSEQLLDSINCNELIINKKENNQVLKSSKFLLFTIISFDHDLKIVEKHDLPIRNHNNCEMEIDEIIE